MTAHDKILAVKDNIARVLVGRENTVWLVLTALVTGGHVLLEDMPGTGKFIGESSGTLNRRRVSPDPVHAGFTAVGCHRTVGMESGGGEI